RADPSVADLAGQLLHVEAMSDADLWQVAQEISPRATVEHRRRACDLAHGSPFRLRRLLGSVHPNERSFSADIGPEVLRGAELLSAAHKALPDAILEHVIEDWKSTKVVLERRGFLEQATGGFRLHDLARVEIQDALLPDQRSAIE